MTIFKKRQLFSFCVNKMRSGAKVSHFRVTKEGVLVVHYAVLGNRIKKADTKHLHFPKIK